MRLHLLSKQIKELRQRAGFSLSELAKRVNTSVPTLSRYESGWERFELYTLEKIALALGYSLEIKFKPFKITPPSQNLTKIIRTINRLFWDHKLEKKDFKNYPVWITERVIEYGNLNDIYLLLGYFGKKVFLKHVSNCKFGSPKTECFWKAILEKENIKCTKKPFQRDAKSYL